MSSVYALDAIGLVPKSHSDKWRMIVDLSSPRGHSVNDGISSAICSLQYATVDDAVGIIRRLGRGTELVKIDLSNAYRMVPVHPEDQPRLGISWNGGLFVDRALPFGLRSAPKLFNAVADFLAWALFREGVSPLIHYLDDFLLFGPPGSGAAAVGRARTESLFGQCNVPIAHHMTEGPATSVTFLGIQIDTITSKIHLPAEKVHRLQALLTTWQSRRACTRKELESLAGHLCHAAVVIRPGRKFLCTLFSLLSRVSHPSHFIRMNLEVRADLTWWRHLLYRWNSFSFFPLLTPSRHVYSDTSGTFGCGAFCAEWFQLPWPSTWADVSSAAKELVPIVIAALPLR